MTSQKEIEHTSRDKWQKTVEHFTNSIRSIRTGRATTALLEPVKVDYYGTPTPLQQLASLSIPEPRMIIVKPYDAGAIQEIEKAILKSDIGLMPAVDGKMIRLAIPPLSEEQRKKLAARVKELAEQNKIALRNNRRDTMKMVDDAQKDKKLSEDEADKLKESLQKTFKDFENKIDEILGKKTTEIMEV